MTTIGEFIEKTRQKLLRTPMSDIRRIATLLNIRGRSSMSKSQLIEAILRDMARTLRNI